MLLFKKKRSKGVATNGVQRQISSTWKRYKESTAMYLQRKSELLSVQAKRYSLIFFCLLSGGTSVAIIIHSATTKTQPVTIAKISKPAHATQEKENYLHIDGSITNQEYDRVEQFKKRLFLLQADSSGRKKFDSIIQTRPRLLDSINLFEKMYLQQK